MLKKMLVVLTILSVLLLQSISAKEDLQSLNKKGRELYNQGLYEESFFLSQFIACTDTEQYVMRKSMFFFYIMNIICCN